MLRYVILGVLRDGTPRHGYAVMKEYRDCAGVDVSIGNFYRETQRLLHDGHVRVAVNPDGADPRRIPYQITTGGSAAFDRWLPSILEQEMVEYQDEVVMRAFLISRAAQRVDASVIARWRDELMVRCHMARLAHEATPPARDGDDRVTLRQLRLARRFHQASADVAFVDEFERAYRARSEALPAARPEAVPSRRSTGKSRRAAGGAA
jgi:DNA-binding PadR family transcriptional regulator